MVHIHTGIVLSEEEAVIKPQKDTVETNALSLSERNQSENAV